MLRQKKGHIVTVASMASFVAAPGILDYSCSKVGALYLSEGQWQHISYQSSRVGKENTLSP
jgi:short-subunit dehydrogenase